MTYAERFATAAEEGHVAAIKARNLKKGARKLAGAGARAGKRAARKMAEDPVKTAADRKQLADQRAELAELNKKLETRQRQGKFDGRSQSMGQEHRMNLRAPCGGDRAPPEDEEGGGGGNSHECGCCHRQARG